MSLIDFYSKDLEPNLIDYYGIGISVIDKLNKEFDVVMNKNIQLEKENIELYKELHKIKFRTMIEDDDNLDNYLTSHLWNWGGNHRHEPDANISDDVECSDDLEYAVSCGLEKNVILCDIYDCKDSDDFREWYGEIELDDDDKDWYGNEFKLLDTFPGNIYN
tara:strand:- start:19 stop:504 length:486 start_codon:yes stop_codon:yes gene_type:complete